MRAEVETYLKLLEIPSSEGGNLEGLASALDDLAYAVHRLPETSDDPGLPDPPRDESQYKRLYDSAATAFPQLGFYPDCDPIGDVSQTATMGDAIDDLADIAGDISDGLWRLHNNGVNDAAWHWRFSYRIHWGEHLHSLRRVVHIQLVRG